MNSFIFIYSLQNAELDLQQDKYALSKDIDVSLWIDFREFYVNLPLQEVPGGNLLLSMKTCMLSLLNSKGKSYHTHCLVIGIELLKVWSRSTKAKLKPVLVLGNIYFLMSP